MADLRKPDTSEPSGVAEEQADFLREPESVSPERPADIAHTLAIKQTGDKSKTLFHDRTLFPRHQHLQLKG